MAEKEIYYVKTRGALVEVTPEIYYAYYRMARHDRYLEEKDYKHGKLQLDDFGLLSEDHLMEPKGKSLEDIVIISVLSEQLRSCIAQLSEREQTIIQGIFYEELSQRKVAEQIGASQRSVSYQQTKIIEKLRKMMKVKI